MSPKLREESASKRTEFLSERVKGHWARRKETIKTDVM